MFIGHFALGLAAKQPAPRLSLASLFAAAELADLVWPVLVALGLEQVRIVPGITAFTPLDFLSYPYSHSLVLLAVWGGVFAGLHRRRGTGGRDLVVLWALVVSHWVLDFIVHRPDLPLYPGGPRWGLSVWNSVAATLAIEVPLFAAGVWVYLRTTRARDGAGRWGLVGLVAILGIAYLGNLTGPPPSVPAVYSAALVGGALLVLWAWWVDRHRALATE